VRRVGRVVAAVVGRTVGAAELVVEGDGIEKALRVGCDLETSMRSGLASAVTVSVSDTSPTLNAKSTVTSEPTGTMTLFLTVPNPLTSTEIS
jgi:hypothetical protein